MKGYNKDIIANFIRLNKHQFNVFKNNNGFFYQVKKVYKNNSSDKVIIKDLSSLSNLYTFESISKQDQDNIEFIKEYPSRQAFFVFQDKIVYEAVEFIGNYEIVGNKIKRRIKILGVSPLNLPFDVSDTNCNIFNFPSLNEIVYTKIGNLEKPNNQNKKEKKKSKVESHKSKKREIKRMIRKEHQRIIYENEKRIIEYEIMMNGKLLTPKFKDEKYKDFVISVIKKYNKVHPNDPIYLNEDIDICNGNQLAEKILNEEIENIVNEKIKNFEPKIENKTIYGFSSLTSENIVGKIELVDRVYGFNRHLHHKFDKNGVVKKFAYAYNQASIKFVELHVFYCETCNTYFDYMESYKAQLKRAGIPIKSLITTHINQYGRRFDFDNRDAWLEISTLKMFGYSVGINGKSVKERRKILRLLLDSQLMSADEIKRYLNHFITYNGEKYGNEVARTHWISDLEYVNEYQKNK